MLLLAVFVLPVFSPLFALSSRDESSLPACCRRNGKHHCSMSAEELTALENGHHFTVIHERCPLYPKSAVVLWHHEIPMQRSSMIYAAIVSHPTAHRQIEAWARVAEEGARHKRGPPAFLLS